METFIFILLVTLKWLGVLVVLALLATAAVVIVYKPKLPKIPKNPGGWATSKFSKIFGKWIEKPGGKDMPNLKIEENATYKWESTSLKPSTGQIGPLKNRTIWFRLDGNPKVKIVDLIGNGKKTLFDERSGFTKTDDNGIITVVIQPQKGATKVPADDQIGILWGIDKDGGTTGKDAAGEKTSFECSAP